MQAEKVLEKQLRLINADQQAAESEHDIPIPTKLYLLMVPLNMGFFLLFMVIEKGSNT